MVRRSFAASFAAVALLFTLLAACAGPASIPVESAADTAVIQESANTCATTYTVHRDGTAQRTVQTCGSGTLNETLPPSVTSKLFSDLQSAQPLGALPRALTVDTDLIIAWNAQQTPNIEGAGTNVIEQSLLGDVKTIEQTFPAQ